MYHHPLPHGQVAGDTRPQLRHLAGEFVTHNQRDAAVTPRAVPLVAMQVRAANAAGRHPHQHFARRQPRLGHILETQLILAVKNDCLHAVCLH